MPWIRKSDGSMGEGDANSDIEIKPEQLKKDITEHVDNKLAESFKTFGEANDAKLKPLLDMAASIAQDKADKAEAARKATENKNREDNQLTTEDFMLDPLDATRRAQAPLASAVKMLAARSAIRETFENVESFPYYTGDVKAKVDAMIAQQPLDAQMRSDVISNCYKAVVHDHLKEIQEGKLKARGSAAMFDGGSSGGHTGKSGESTTETLTEEEKAAAKVFGMSEADWSKSKRELSYV